jgi:hypothetical protein
MLLAGLAAGPAGAQQTADTSSEVPPQAPAASSSALPTPRANQYSSNEIVDAGHHFFGGISHGLASIVEKAVSQWGLPNAQVGRPEETVARACRQLADRYQFFVTGWRGGGIDDALKQQLVTVVQTALRQSPGVEGGICIQCRAVSGLEWRKVSQLLIV